MPERAEPWRNVVWQSLTGPQEPLAQVHGRARRFQPEVAPFAALPDDPTADDWHDLAELGGGEPVVLFRADPTVPNGWEVRRTWLTYQMTAGDPPNAVAGVDLVEPLGASDAPEMVDLTELTNPGPFLERTVELGTYLGVRSRGRLVAMAGERFRPPGASEISAVCTHPDHRGRGLARALVAVLVEQIRARGETAFLHVVRTNPAKRVYDGLGFRVCLEPTAVLVAR